MFSQRTSISDRTPLQSLLRISITIFTGFLLVGPFLGILLAAVVFDNSMESFLKGGHIDAAMAQPLIFIQGVTTFIGLIVFPILHITRLEHKPLAPLIDNRSHLTRVLLLV